MNDQQYLQWRSDAEDALLKVYSTREADVVLRWFDNIKASEECDLLGHESFHSMMDYMGVLSRNGVWSLYNSLMSRLFVYAPLILKEHYNA